MGQLFQPTNIIPNVLGEFGQGVADVTKPLTISWQVNGNVPMTKYKIRLLHYRDDNVGGNIEVTVDPPFYGRDENGDVVRFSHTIEPVDMSGVWENGFPCKYILTLYWGSGEGESVTTLSKCVFLARATPTLSINEIADPYASINFSASATYNQADGDSILWVQWQFADMSIGEPRIIKDTGRMYGVSQLAFSSDGLASGGLYGIRCIVETESGALAETDWSVFETEYTVEMDYNTFTVTNSCNDSGNIAAAWADFRYFPTTRSGPNPSLIEDKIKLQDGSSLAWNKADGNDELNLHIPPKWSFIYRGNIEPGSGNLFEQRIGIYFSPANALTSISVGINGSGDLDVTYNFGTRAITLAQRDGIDADTDIALAITPTKILISVDGMVEEVDQNVTAYSDKEIRQITVTGPQSLGFLIVQAGDLSNDLFENFFVKEEIANIGNTWKAPYRLFMSKHIYLQSMGAGLNRTGAQNGQFLKGYSLYREEPGSSTLIPVIDDSANTINILDYGARNGKGPFIYHLFVERNEGEQPPVLRAVSDPVTICYWSYILLSCTKNENGEYIVQKSYRFRYNIETGVISNNNRPNILDSFTRYPLVQMANNNYKTGSLQGLIGTVSGCDATYEDTLAMRDELMGLSASPNYLFLKDRKGDLVMIRPAGEVTIEVGDKTPQQEQRITFPWVEVGSADGVSVYEIV